MISKLVSLLTPLDWLAAAIFLSLWIGYQRFARTQSAVRPSLQVQMSQFRSQWVYQLTFRDNRIADVSAMANLSSSPTFFASTSILILGGLLALFPNVQSAAAALSELPFITPSPPAVWELKIGALIGTYIICFAQMSWSLRLFNFSTILINAAPLNKEFETGDNRKRREYADQVGHMFALAGDSFNDGLRAIYFSFAQIAWFIHPIAFIAATMLIVAILYWREFHSTALNILMKIDRGDVGPQ